MSRHVPVLLKEVIEGLNVERGEIFLDGTLGSGGHSLEMARELGGEVTIVGLDRDKEAIERSRVVLKTTRAQIHLAEGNFRHMDKILEDLGYASVDAILLDLGISSEQIDEAGRGFSFQKDEPMKMTMELGADLDACKILNFWSEESLELIIRGFGEEKYSRKIARAIVERREVRPLETTEDLVEAVLEAVPKSYERGRIHPATRTFQAIRIAVNAELDALEEGLAKGFELLNPTGRFAIISFHSLEDRIVKNFGRHMEAEGRGKSITKKPITPSDEEVASSPRSRSAKLRIIEKIS